MLSRKAVSTFIFGTAFALALAGCSDTTPTEDPGEEVADTTDDSVGADEKDLTIGLVMLQGDEYFNNVLSGMTEAVEADGGTLIQANSENDAGKEATEVQNMIQRQVDAIVIQPVSGQGSLATLESIKAAGIPVICYGNCTDGAADPDVVDGVVQSDNTALGTATAAVAAEFIKTELDGSATIGILNCDSAAETCKLRKSGFKEELENAGLDVTYAADQEGYLADAATTVATNMLSADPSINLLWAANEGGTVGLVTASKASGSNVPVFGTDISEQLAGFLLEGDPVLRATTGQDPAGTAKIAYEQAKNVIGGGNNDPLEELVPGVTYRSDSPETVEEYLNK